MENQMMLFANLAPDVQAIILKAQRDEETGSLIYAYMEKRLRRGVFHTIHKQPTEKWGLEGGFPHR